MKNWRTNIEQVFGPLSLSWILPLPPNFEDDGTDFPIYKEQNECFLDPIDPLHFEI